MTIRFPLLAALTMGTAPLLSAQRADTRAQILVSPEWVAERINDPNVVILHVGAEEDYAKEHLPGAHLVGRGDYTHPDSHSPDRLILELPEPEAFEAVLNGYGVTPESQIIVYWGSEWVTPTARVVFTLDWAGLGDRTVLMDGGIDAWKAGGHPVTDAVPPTRHGHFRLTPRSDLVVDAPWVQEHATKPGYALIDARAAAFYDGVRAGHENKEGHIPGAGNIPWTELIDEALHLKDAATFETIFTSAGVEPGDTVVGYCHIGQYATLVLFVARTLGYDVKLYDGAFQDWAQHDLPVEPAGKHR